MMDLGDDLDVPAGENRGTRIVEGVGCETQAGEAAAGRGGAGVEAPDAKHTEATDNPIALRVERDDGTVGQRHIIGNRARIEVTAQNRLFRAATTCREKQEQKQEQTPSADRPLRR
jgi:hypothetical protein